MHARRARYAPALILALLALGYTEPAASAADKADGRRPLETRLKQLRGERVTAAEKACAAYLAAYQADTVTLDDVIWSIDALWKAELGVADSAEQRKAAHVKRVEKLWQLQIQVKDLYDNGRGGGEAEKMARVEFCLLDAEIELIDEYIAEGPPYPAILDKLQNRPKLYPHHDGNRDDVVPAADPAKP